MTSQANRDKSRALREAAELRGDITYAGATPCPRGHWLRYTACRKCVECAKQAVKRRRELVKVPRELLERCLSRMESDWERLDGEWGPTKGGLAADIANGYANEIRDLRAALQ